MQTKKMKVQYSSRARQSKSHYFGSGYIETPKIQMEGKWLEALGFHIGGRHPGGLRRRLHTHLTCTSETVRVRYGLRYKSRIRIQIILIKKINTQE